MIRISRAIQQRVKLVRYKGTFNFPKVLNEIDPDVYEQLVPDQNDQIVIAMSSGVDSSVAASIYAKRFPNVRGIYMANWSQSSKCIEADWNDVKRICSQLNIPCDRVNFEKEYWNDVFEPMILDYKRGLTPNPDVGCNKYVKFGKMIEHLTTKIGENGHISKWWLVTGHYARVMKHRETGDMHLLRGLYPNKDQSFYLSMLPKDVMSRVLMPIGHMIKPEVREIAKADKLITADKPDSQGLCFVSQELPKFRDFLDEYIPPNPGNIITEDGKIWGEHKGLWHATIGQRLGVSMPQGDPKYKGVWFVSEKRVDTNEIVIVKGGSNDALFRSKLFIRNWEWLTNKIADLDADNLSIQYRSLQDSANKVKSILLDEQSDVSEIELIEEARAMAPGQNLVLYDGNRVLGAGIIADTA